MPTYTYDCPDCGDFDAFRSIARRHEPAVCPACGASTSRLLPSAPRLASLAGGQRRAIELNERAAHAPRSSRDPEPGYARLKHPSGCGCCGRASGSTGIRSATVRSATGEKAFPTKRPWMISH
jgi:putative FmdB family regulatory protein